MQIVVARLLWEILIRRTITCNSVVNMVKALNSQPRDCQFETHQTLSLWYSGPSLKGHSLENTQILGNKYHECM